MQWACIGLSKSDEDVVERGAPKVDTLEHHRQRRRDTEKVAKIFFIDIDEHRGVITVSRAVTM